MFYPLKKLLCCTSTQQESTTKLLHYKSKRPRDLIIDEDFASIDKMPVIRIERNSTLHGKFTPVGKVRMLQQKQVLF